MKRYLRYGFFDSRLHTGPSGIDGTGIFTQAPIRHGETVMIWGGIPILKKDFDETKYRFSSVVPIDDLTYLGLPVEDTHESIDEYLNHSCDSNTWMNDDVTIVARRDIQKGEEITLDACLSDCDTEYAYLVAGTCACGSEHCRAVLTSKDWMDPQVQKRYQGHFLPYIQEKIDNLRSRGGKPKL